jgi:proteic killer suppression protein
MIVKFGDKITEAIYHGTPTKGIHRIPPNVRKVAWRKLDMVNGARSLRDLLAPPGNRLESLHGDLKGYHSIRINDQWRVIFRWHEGNAYDVRITDYH